MIFNKAKVKFEFQSKNSLYGQRYLWYQAATAVKAGMILPVSSEPITNGIVLIRNGKIEAVGQGIEIPDDAKVLDASDKVVIPGLIDAFTTLAGQQDDERTMTPDVKAEDAFDFYGNYRRILADHANGADGSASAGLHTGPDERSWF